MTPDKAIEAVVRVSDMLDDGQLVRMADAVKLRAALPTLRRMAEERREAVEVVKDLIPLAKNAMREVGEYDIDGELADARAFLRRVEEGGSDEAR